MSLRYLENLCFNTETGRLLTFKWEITTSISAFNSVFLAVFLIFFNLIFQLFKIFLSFYFLLNSNRYFLYIYIYAVTVNIDSIIIIFFFNLLVIAVYSTACFKFTERSAVKQ